MYWKDWLKGFRSYISANLGNSYSDSPALNDKLMSFKEDSGANQYDRIITIRELANLISTSGITITDGQMVVGTGDGISGTSILTIVDGKIVLSSSGEINSTSTNLLTGKAVYDYLLDSDLLSLHGTTPMHSILTDITIISDIYTVSGWAQGSTSYGGIRYSVIISGVDLTNILPINSYIVLRDSDNVVLGYRSVAYVLYSGSQSQVYYIGALSENPNNIAKVNGFNYEPNDDYEIVNRKFVTDNYVPYTEATSNVNLGDNDLYIRGTTVNDKALTKNTLGYKVYTALLNQSGTDAPVATIIQNTLGEVTWGRLSVGNYTASCPEFKDNKTICFIGAATDDGSGSYLQFGYVNSDKAYLYSRNTNTGFFNELSSQSYDNSISIEIKVYD